MTGFGWERRGQRMAANAGCTKNDDFCIGEFSSNIKAQRGLDDDFCIPGRKCGSRKIKGLSQILYTFVYFSLLCMFGRDGFVWNQWVDRHGCVTKVIKTGVKVCKRYTFSGLAGGHYQWGWY